MGNIFETVMVVLFGISWPISIYKSWTSRSSKGKSALFLGFIIAGYLAGIASKIIKGDISYVLVFYILNTVMVSIDMAIYFRNKHIERRG